MRSWLLLALLLAGCGGDQPARVAVPAPDPGPLRVEAEACPTTGLVRPFSTALHTPEAEASGRQDVALPPGGRLTLRVPGPADAIVVRCSVPDAADGGGLDGSLQVLTGGAIHELPVTSRFSWEYGKPRWNTADVWWSDPAQGQPRHFWDETSLRLPPLAAGDVIELLNPEAQGRTVLVDFVEFESVPPPLEPLPGSLSFADWHPDRSGVADATALLQAALDAAVQQGRPLHLPEGTYRIDAVQLRGGVVRGAGMWRTRFVGRQPRFHFSGSAATVSDLAIFGGTTQRNDHSDDDNACSGRPGDGSRLERIWVEHAKCAWWIVADGPARPTRGLVISGCRFRNLMADGVNLCNGATGCVIEDCLVRNTGDDGLAAWSPDTGGRPAGGGHTIRRNLIELPWVASGIALYGGGPFTVEGNTIRDTVTTGSGIFVSASFKSWPFAGEIRIADNLMVRCGAHESGPGGPTGAIRLLALDRDMTAATFVLNNNRIVAPLESGVSLQGPRRISGLTISGLVVEELGAAVVLDVRPKAQGSAELVGFRGPDAQSPWRIAADASFTLLRR